MLVPLAFPCRRRPGATAPAAGGFLSAGALISHHGPENAATGSSYHPRLWDRARTPEAHPIFRSTASRCELASTSDFSRADGRDCDATCWRQCSRWPTELGLEWRPGFRPSQIARVHPSDGLQLVRILAPWPYRGCTSPRQHRTKRGRPLLRCTRVAGPAAFHH